MVEYRPRLAESVLDDKLESAGAVLIVGPKWCGKTTLAKRRAKTVVNVDTPANLQLAQISLTELLKGEPPSLLDEWQWVPELWDEVRRSVDERSSMGQYILTGSAVPPDLGKIRHTGTGRFSWMFLRTMSLLEMGESNGKVTLAELFTGPDKIFAKNGIDFPRLAYLVCRGGWPGSLGMKERASLQIPFNYLEGLVQSDMSRVDGIKRNPDRVARLLRSLARHQGSQVALSVISADMAANEDISSNSDTVYKYIEALKKLYVEEDMPAWNPNVRSKVAIRTSDTRYFSDSSIAVASLGIGPKDLQQDLNTFGFLFETLAVHDLRVYAELLDGTVYHYRDAKGVECDAVIHLRNGKYGLVEVKIGGNTAIEQGAESLKKLAKNIDVERMLAPSFMAVIVGLGDYAYRREDGVYVVPIGCLG